MSRITLSLKREDDPTDQSRKLSDFLFTRCPGNVAELAVLDYLRRCYDQGTRFPWTKSGELPEIGRAVEAVMKGSPADTRNDGR